MVDTMQPTEPTIADRLAEAKKRQADEDEKVRAADDARELLILDLRAKCRAEQGKEGQDFQVVEFSVLDKVVALKRAEKIVVMTFDKLTSKREGTHEEVLAYVLPSVLFPTPNDFRELSSKHPKLLTECAGVLRELEGLRLPGALGKIDALVRQAAADQGFGGRCLVALFRSRADDNEETEDMAETAARIIVAAILPSAPTPRATRELPPLDEPPPPRPASPGATRPVLKRPVRDVTPPKEGSHDG